MLNSSDPSRIMALSSSLNRYLPKKDRDLGPEAALMAWFIYYRPQGPIFIIDESCEKVFIHCQTFVLVAQKIIAELVLALWHTSSGQRPLCELF